MNGQGLIDVLCAVCRVRNGSQAQTVVSRHHGMARKTSFVFLGLGNCPSVFCKNPNPRRALR